jgi:hypothetical protein
MRCYIPHGIRTKTKVFARRAGKHDKRKNFRYGNEQMAKNAANSFARMRHIEDIFVNKNLLSEVARAASKFENGKAQAKP